MRAEEIEEQEAALAASIREQQELLDAYRKVKAHQRALQAGAQTVPISAPSDNQKVSETDHKETVDQSVGMNPPSEPTSKSGVVRDAITAFPGNFTVNEVYDWLVTQTKTSLKKSDVSFVLSRFAKSGEIDQIEQGGGRKPSTYSSRQKNFEGSSTE